MTIRNKSTYFLLGLFMVVVTPAAHSANNESGINSELKPNHGESTDAKSSSGQPLSRAAQGYVTEIPAQTIVPIILISSVNSDTSQEGDEFKAKTLEPLLADDGTIVLTQGAVIKGTLTSVNAWPSDAHMTKRALLHIRIETINEPGTGMIPISAQLTSRGGVVHGKRDGEDFMIDIATFTRPPFTILCAKKGKIIDLRAGDEFKLYFGDSVRIPMP